jgi:malate/lactate dehydrogenase
MVTVDIVEAILMDQNKVLPVSYRLENCNGINDVCLGIPAVIGRSGIVKPWELNLTPEEKTKLQKSAEIVKKYL